MGWLIASVPFWLGGVMFFGASAWGVVRLAHTPRNDPGDNDLMAGSAFCFAISCVLLPVAAWMVS